MYIIMKDRPFRDGKCKKWVWSCGMNIVSLCFIGYVLIVTGGYYVVPARFRPQWLLASSLFFYLYADLWCVLYLAFSVISTWACALILDGRQEKAKGLVALTVGLNLAVLAAVALEEQPVRPSTPAAAITPIREIKVLRFISKNSFLS